MTVDDTSEPPAEPLRVASLDLPPVPMPMTRRRRWAQHLTAIALVIAFVALLGLMEGIAR